ncbi:MAG: TetR/AcrR family transcriptional regulator [Bacteroidia bacterium]|nr:TetR/AcrR family transcriptional regulator [Bacteroidia bacterium]
MNRKEQITETAAKLFRKKGYIATTMRDLAAELGIEAASIYHHVKSKEELLETICFDMANKFILNAKEVNDIYFNAEEKLRLAIKLHIETITQNQNKSAVFLQEWRNLNEPNLSKFKMLRDQYENQFTIIIIDGENEDIFDFVDKKFAVLSILSTINFVNEWYKPEGKMNAAEIAEKLSSFILGGLRKKATLNR